MLEIDGSHGEGGGQILRTSVALSALNGTPIVIKKIRNNRPRPGLAAQHMTGIMVAGELCGAVISGLKKGSTEITFEPGEIKGGSYKFDIGTAGSITLVLQAVLPLILRAGGTTTLDLIGGTDVKFAPPIDYFKFVMKPKLEKMGAVIDLKETVRGYYPRGGGRVVIEITPPAGKLKNLELAARGKLNEIWGTIHSANLPGHISTRIKNSAEAELNEKYPNINVDLEIERVENSRSPGVGINLCGRFDNTVLGSNSIGERGLPAEKLAIEATAGLITEIKSGASVDAYAADQLLPFLIGTSSVFLTRKPLSDHTLTNLAVINRFSGDVFKMTEREHVIKLESE
jgi:RNA 3'-phosphate cyclase